MEGNQIKSNIGNKKNQLHRKDDGDSNIGCFSMIFLTDLVNYWFNYDNLERMGRRSGGIWGYILIHPILYILFNLFIFVLVYGGVN